MTADLPPQPDGPPIPEVIYTPEEAVAWIRTMTPEALVKASREKPDRFPRSKPGREVGFSGDNILTIIAGLKAAQPKLARSTTRRRSSQGSVTELPQNRQRLTAKPEAARRRRKAS